MKKFIVLALSLIAVFCFAACGGNNAAPKADKITGITFTGAEYDYDGTEKKIEIKGTLPDGVNVKYTDNKGTDAGTYNAKAVLSGEGFETEELTATLKINKISYDMTAVSWDYNAAFTYDGNQKTVSLTGEFPTGVTLKNFVNCTATDAGEYTAKAVFDYDTVNHNEPKVADLIWKINKADIEGITLSDDKVEYDAKTHSLQIVGNVPSGVVCEYYYDDIKADGVTAVGVHMVKCVLSGKNYNTLTLNAKLTVTSTEKQLYSAFFGDKVYFQNDLDGEKLYAADGTGIKKINNDIPNYMIAGNNELYYFGTSLFSKVIKSYDGTAASTLYSEAGEYLATDGVNLYYAVNNLIMHTDSNGIYKVPLSGNAEPVRLTADKAEYLTYCNGYIYYSNAGEKDYFYRISVNASLQKGELLKEEAASYLITDGADVYFNSTKKAAGVVGVASAIYKYSPSTGRSVKLTTDAGKYLVKSGSYIYYINNDKLTSAIFGDGIYRVSALTSSDSSLPGVKIISAEDDGYSSLATDGIDIYYYKLNDKHFYKYDLSENAETDLMKNFTPPEEKTALSGYSNAATYKGEVYYTNPADYSCLYKYNPTSKASYKVLADSVSKMYFNGDYVYYNTFILTNYAFWRMNLTNGEIEKLSSGRYENLLFEGDDIYCVKMTASTNYICKFNAADKTETVVYDKKPPNVVGFEKCGNDFYFIMNPAIGYQYIYKFDGASQTAAELNGIKAKHLAVYGDKIYYYASDNKFKVCDLNGENIAVLKENVEINDIYAVNGKVYFSSVSKNNTGFFVYDTANGTVDNISDKPANGITECGGKIYFIRSSVSYTKGYPTQDGTLDGCLYCYDGTTVKKV